MLAPGGGGQYEGRASLRPWLTGSRPPVPDGAAGRRARPRTSAEGPTFLTAEPTPGVSRCGWSPTRSYCSKGCRCSRRPEARYEAKEAVALVFVTAVRPAAAAAGRTSAKGRARAPVIRGRGHAGQQRGRGRRRASAGRAHYDDQLPGPDPERAPLPRSGRERASRHGSRRLSRATTSTAWFAADRRRLVHHASGHARVPGSAAIAGFLRASRAGAVPATTGWSRPGPTAAPPSAASCRRHMRRCSARTG